MSSLHFAPISGRAEEIIDTTMAQAELASWPKMEFTFRLVIEEIVVNVVNYAYPEGVEGWLDVDISSKDGDISITFTDGGTPFNPLAKEDPDTTLPLDQRPIGGLGILLVKKMMDHVAYRHEEGRNILTLTKHLEQQSR